jgi:2-alkenal reductase
MNGRRLAVALALSATVLTVLASGWSVAQQSERTIFLDVERRTIEIFERASPSVVHISARKGSNDVFSTDHESTGVLSGSGFVWDTAGHVVTNDHVVDGTNSSPFVLPRVKW